VYWNYRVCKKVSSYKVDLSNDVYEEDQFGICEVYYKDEGEIAFTSENFIEPYGETLEELKANFDCMKKAFEHPVLDLDNIVYTEY
jgi:hypothetical protein